MNSVKNSPILELEKNNDVGLKIAKVIAFVLVLIGMLNTIPAIPGRVKTAPRPVRIPKIKRMFKIRAKSAKKPDIP